MRPDLKVSIEHIAYNVLETELVYFAIFLIFKTFKQRSVALAFQRDFFFYLFLVFFPCEGDLCALQKRITPTQTQVYMLTPPHIHTTIPGKNKWINQIRKRCNKRKSSLSETAPFSVYHSTIKEKKNLTWQRKTITPNRKILTHAIRHSKSLVKSLSLLILRSF